MEYLSFFNFMLNAVDMESSETASVYASWYEGYGALAGAIIPLVVSLIFVVVFYYLWSKLRATTTFHWCVAGFVNMIVTFVLNLFIGKAMLAQYVEEFEDSSYDYIIDTINSFSATLDLWIFALNGIIWAIVFYFIWSVLLKRWSTVYNIPFGKKYKQSKN